MERQPAVLLSASLKSHEYPFAQGCHLELDRFCAVQSWRLSYIDCDVYSVLLGFVIYLLALSCAHQAFVLLPPPQFSVCVSKFHFSSNKPLPFHFSAFCSFIFFRWSQTVDKPHRFSIVWVTCGQNFRNWPHYYTDQFGALYLCIRLFGLILVLDWNIDQRSIPHPYIKLDFKVMHWLHDYLLLCFCIL